MPDSKRSSPIEATNSDRSLTSASSEGEVQNQIAKEVDNNEDQNLEMKKSTTSVWSEKSESLDRKTLGTSKSRSKSNGSLETDETKTTASESSKDAKNMTKTEGEPIKLLEIDPESKQIIFYENELKELIERNNAKDKFICVCSIAGDYRKGKSFLMNYCIRFLMNNHDYLNRFTDPNLDQNLNPEWIGHVDKELVGFSWRSGVDLETIGIWIWSEFFPCKVPKSNFNISKTGSSNVDTIVNSSDQTSDHNKSNRSTNDNKDEYDDAMICLIDSQGAFDEKSTISDCSIIFSILFLISSMQIYNVFHQLQEDNLHYLQLFTEYGRLINEEGIHCKPFQRLTFLIRDWFSPAEFDFGNKGGEKYLQRKFQPEINVNKKTITKNKRLNLDLRSNRENLLTRRHIQRCFDKIDCFLLPQPGKFVASSRNYNGNWGEMQFEFCLKLKEFVEWWFSDLQIKRTTDYLPRKMTGSDFLTFFKLLTVRLSENGNKTLRPVTLFDSMAKISHNTVLEDCIKQFQTKMNLLFGAQKPFIWPHNIEKIAKMLEEQTRTDYLKRKKFGNRQFEREYIAKLNQQFKEIITYYLNLNELKCTVLPAYLLMIFIIVLTHIASIAIKIFLPFWSIKRLSDWLMTIEMFFLFFAVSVELFGCRYGATFIGYLRKRLQCIYHLTRARKIDLTMLNSLKF